MSSSLGVRQWFPEGDLARHAREFGIAFVDDEVEDGVLKTECVSPPPTTLPPVPPLIPLASDDSEEPAAYGGVFMVNSESPVFSDSAVVNMCGERGCCAGDASRCSVVLDPLPSDLLRSLTEDGRISAEKAAREQCSSGECVVPTQDRIDCAEESRDSRRGARHRKRRRESSGGGKGKRRKRSTSCSTTSSMGSTASRPHHHHKHHKHRRRRSKTADEGSPPPAPSVNPIFVWVKQDDTRIVEVLCEDYDKRNRIRLTKTPYGWRAIPRTERLASVSQTAPSSTSSCSGEAPLDREQCDNSPTDGGIDNYVTTLVTENVDHPAPVAGDENSTDQITKEHDEREGEVEVEVEKEGEGEGEGEENVPEEQEIEECRETEMTSEETCDNTTCERQNCTDTEVEEMEPTDLSIPKTSTDMDSIPVKTVVPILPAAPNPQPTPMETSPTPAHQPKPQHKSMFLESLLSSPKKCYQPPTQTPEEPQPLDLGVSLSRGSSSPTVSGSEEKKIPTTPDSKVKTKCLKVEDITLKNLLSRQSSKVVERTSTTPEVTVETTKAQKSRLLELLTSEPLSLDQEVDDPLTQLKKVLSDPELSVPDPMLVPRDRLRILVASPAREIPRLLSSRPELRFPEALAYPTLVQDPGILVVSLAHFQRLLQNWTEEDAAACMSLRDYQMYKQQQEAVAAAASEFKQQQDNGELAAALNQMFWLPYLTQLEAAAVTCGNTQEFLTMLNAVFPPSNYPQVQGRTQHQYPFLVPFSLPSTDYKTQLEFQQAVTAWHETMMQAAVSAAPVSNNNNNNNNNSYSKNHHQQPINGRFPHVAKKVNSSSARTSPISPSFQSRAPNTTHEYLAANGYTNNHHHHHHHHQYNHHRSHHHHQQQQQQQPARSNSGTPKVPKSETQTPTDNDKGPKVTCNSLIHLLSNSKKQQQEEPVKIKRCVSLTAQSQHSHLLAALGNPPNNMPQLVPIPQGVSPPTPIDLSGRRQGDKMAVTTGKLKVKKHLVDPAITPRLLKQEVEAISPTDKTSHPQLWHPLFGSQKTPYTSPWQWTTVMVNGE